MKWKSFFKKIMIFVLALTIINSTITSSVALSTMSLLKLYDSEVETNTSVDETNQTEENTNKNTLQTQPGGGTVFQDDAINIYNIAQLKAIGTNKIVYENDGDATTFGTGNVVVDNDNNVVTYSLSANYRLMNDIPLNINDLWQLPEDFTGKFVSEDITENPVYDKTTDTMYVYHSYQLQTIASNTGDQEPVMSKDANPELYGMGQLTYIDDNNYVTYSKEHNYVLSKLFTGTRPSMISAVYANNNVKSDDQKAGRDYVGQIIKEIDGIEYILIGSKEQLFAIGKKEYGSLLTEKRYAQVTGPAYSYSKSKGFTLEYCGDADLELNSNSNENNNGKIIDDGADNGLSPVKWYGVNENGIPSLDCEGKQTTGKYYAPDENYIIFRNIDLNNEEWTPLMFSGTMEGRLNMVSGANPEIKNVKIVQNGKLPIDEYIGIGFFGTISNKVDSTTSVSKGTAKVSNITLNHVSVENYSTDVKKDFSLIGVVLSPIINEISSGLKEDISTFATGGFAGRIQGDAIVANCEVKNLDKLTNEASVTGGFAGNIEGTVRYEIITDGLGSLLTKVSDLLNIIPILGLGDLITILLNGGLLDVGDLLPIGYYTPTVKNCRVSGINTTEIGNINTNFHGAFSGKQEGSIVQDCKVESTNSLTVNAKNYAGGFSGVIANGEISGTLESLGIDIADFTLQSVNANSELSLPDIVVNAQENYAGGFTGSLFSSYAIDCTINLVDEKNSQNEKINAKNYAGGFAGRSTIGWGITVGKEFDSKYDDNLLTKVKGLLNTILQNNKEGDILSLVGIYPSEFYGVQINADNLKIESKESYTGGLIGQADALKINKSNQQFVNELRPFEKKLIDYVAKDRETLITGLCSVNSESNYAGGLIGQVKPMSVAGLLNSTVGISNYFGFDIEDVIVNAKTSGFNISAKRYAGGAIGQGIGGKIENVDIKNINVVNAENYAGGFVASAGTGSLTKVGGLDILGLIEIKDLLSLAEAVSFDANNCTVNGISGGFTVETTGESATTNGDLSYYAGGFVGENSSSNLESCSVENLKYVGSDKQDGRSGGFAAEMSTDGLAGIADDSNEIKLPGIVNVNGLVSAAGYLIPKYQNCNVSFVSNDKLPQVEGAIAGGFIGNMGAGTVDNSKLGDSYTVSGLENVLGTYYAGGFAGKAMAGGFVNSGNGIKLLGVINLASLDNLLNVLEVYIPKIINADVSSSATGLIVKASLIDSKDANSGSAGGFVGFGSSVQISDSDVNGLRYIDLASKLIDESVNSKKYYEDTLQYAVDGQRNAGGYAGKIDIGSVANAVDGLDVLGQKISLANLAEVLDVTSSRIENSDVKGAPGGYSVRANGKADSSIVGNAGGYVGAMYGSALQNSNVSGFEYIVGQETAGGYAGRIEPGNVANVIEDTSILDGVANVSNLLSAIRTFIPMIYNSKTSGVLCGGYVIANGESNNGVLRGTAGGYVGYNLGGRIEGNSSREWKNVVDGTSVKPGENTAFELRKNSIERLRLVEGYEFAGGFTGKLETANIADAGSLNLLFNLIKVNNLLGVLSVVYPEESNTSVDGPLTNVTVEEWKTWKKAIGSNGVYGDKFNEISDNIEQNALNEKLANYKYGYKVRAGRTTAATLAIQGGVAGGYVGRMDGGKITEGNAADLKSVTAYRNSGGFAGEIMSADVASIGGIEIGKIDVIGNLDLLNDFVPIIKNSSVTGYKSGATITTKGTDHTNFQGNAGGFVGKSEGGQIDYVEANNIKTVKGTNAIGGFAGSIIAGSAADVNTEADSGLLNAILGSLIGTSGNLATVLQATLPTVKHAKVAGLDNSGLFVDGRYNYDKETKSYKYARNAGGFAGFVIGAIIGDKDAQNVNESDSIDASVQVKNLVKVTGGEHVGGFLGLGDVSAVAQVGDSQDTSLAVKILNLIKLGNIDVLDVFRPYVYNAKVIGLNDRGFNVNANTVSSSGTLDSKVYVGNAGGFAGSLLNGTVKDSEIVNLASVNAKAYGGGFIGHMGKSGAVDIDKIGSGSALEGLLNGTVGVLDVFGSYADNCLVKGIENGFTVKSLGAKEHFGSTGPDYDGQAIEVAGGFVGNGDLARISASNVKSLRQVSSGQIAGGFIGRSSFEYLTKIQANSKLLNLVLNAVNELIKALYLDKLQEVNVIHINLGIIELDALYDGNTLSLDLLGLKISVALNKPDDGQTDFAIVKIGDSEIKLPCNEDGFIGDQTTNIEVNLIKANRTRVKDSSVEGIDIGYDVFAGGATNKDDGKDINGYAGGFVGLNHEGLLDNNKMIKADTIRGTANKIGEFSGTTTLESSYGFNTVYGIEGNHNTYQVYRLFDNDNLTKICIGTEGNKILVSSSTDVEISGTNYYLYNVVHLNANSAGAPSLDGHNNWKNAYQTAENESVRIPLKVYVSEAQADLMLGTPTGEVVTDPPKEDDLAQDPCSQDAFITIQKRWIDDNNASGDREGSISVTIIQKKEDGSVINIDISMDSSMAHSDENSWSIVKKLPMYYEKDDGTFGKYTYEVVENPINGYLTIYDQSKDGYTFYITNYRTTAIMNGDSVVIDYGLPVTVDVLANDRVNSDTEINGELVGVAKINRDGETGGVNLDENSVTEEQNMSTEYQGNYGKAKILDTNSDGKKESIRYSPTNMNMDSFEKLLYEVHVKGKTKNNQNYVYSTLDVIPATEIYYEDDFKTVEYHNGTFKEGEVPEGNKWQEDGIKDDDREQDSTRPGVETITKVLDDQTKKEYDNLYGFDTSYLEDSTYSRGSSHYISVNSNFKNDDFPSISFEFTGTGFDVISLTSNKTGTIITRLYEPDGKGGYKELPSRSWIVDTYYGYVYDDILHQWVPAGDSEESKPLYQVPIIRSGDNSKGLLEYGKYKVTITLTYSESIDQTPDKGGYDFYFDGVRIYGSANKTNNDYNVIDDAYNLDKENNPEYLEIRKMLLSRQDNDNLDLPQPGVGFIDGKDEGATLNDYEDYGPKNETYLKKGQAISFYLESKYLPDSVQFGAKIAQGNNIDLKISCANKENDEWKYYKGKTLTINSATELYRDLSDQCIWDEYEVDGEIKYRTRYPIVITNTSNTENIISLTNVKLTGGPDTDDTVAVNFFAYTDFNAVEAAYSLARSQFEKKITVKYVDQNGQMLADDVITKVDVNNEYDVTDLVNKEIAGYTRLEVKGDTTGIADSDKEITVVYGKNYQLAVKYVDLQGNKIEETYVNSGVEGNEYDVTDLVNKEITGYTRLEVKGDTTGVIDSDKEITVVYGKNYQLAVKYVDLQGNKIEETYVNSGVEGNEYDVTDLVNKEITGYTRLEVKGDTTGVIDSDKEITVVYGKNYQLTVKYVDENGNELTDTYSSIGVESSSYDLSEYVSKTINGYVFKTLSGDAIKGIVDQDKLIMVIYTQEANENIISNNNQNSNNQTVNDKVVNSTKTGDNLNLLLPIIGLCLSIFVYFVAKQSKKTENE